ncbi:hypothetical protein [Streptomyces sp. NPDC004976]
MVAEQQDGGLGDRRQQLGAGARRLTGRSLDDLGVDDAAVLEFRRVLDCKQGLVEAFCERRQVDELLVAADRSILVSGGPPPGGPGGGAPRPPRQS